MKPKVCLVSLGCAKNLVDSENMLGLLKAQGFDLAPELNKADIGIVNTCGFIQPAIEESIGMILDIAGMKSAGKLKKLYVTGCLVQRFGYKLKKEMPEVDGWLGTGEIHRIARLLKGNTDGGTPFLINRPIYLADHKTPRIQSSPFYTAYVKLAEGCSHRCSYCTIPGIRGPLRSRATGSVVTEVASMVERGVKEINLIAQDTTSYGKDLKNGACLENLLEKLVSIKGLQWIRILYSHPHGISDHLLSLMEAHEEICPYLDIPLQHVHSGILEKMGRYSKQENPWQLVERLRNRKRPIALRSTLMVGFPGETDDAFRELYDFVSQAKFEHLGVFIYSPEKGTRAARLGQNVDRKAAEERRDALMRLQAGISLEKHKGMIGKVVAVLMEGRSEETDLLLKGRTAAMAPDVDAQILINKGKGSAGEILPVKILEAYEYDLIGEICSLTGKGVKSKVKRCA
ncbi:MAG: 30S ribosomal protein S12 methylthiotransferase RimO [Deltaproteobacteria bacterium]|nr:30S ribosomal protein S12 methylthiotransferase RimO [Deltaproteobacteria bacterium]